ncbi:BMT1 Beta-mannosyltransferase 1 [Candida maltosa Xu316]
MNTFIRTSSYSKIGASNKPLRNSQAILGFLFIIALLSIITTFLYSRSELLQEILTKSTTTTTTSTNYQDIKNDEENIVAHQQTHKDNKRIIIFPNNFEMRDNKLADFYIKDMQQALDPQDLIYRNRFTHEIPKELQFSSQKVELFDAGTDMSSADSLNVEASQVLNKNANLKKALTKFMNENDDYYQELSIFFPNLQQQIYDDIIEKHWYHLIGSSVWLKQYGVHLMISRIIYSEKDQGYPKFSLSYLQVFDRNWKELDNVELIVPDAKNKGSFKTVSYPQFASIPVYHNIDKSNGIFYGIEDPRIKIIINPEGYEEPVIIYNSLHRKIKDVDFENDGEGNVKLSKHRSIFLGWVWQTQKGKSNIEELPNSKQKQSEYIKVKELIKPDGGRKSQEKNWVLFINHEERQKHGFDVNLYFVYQLKNLKVLKCSIYEDTECEWEYEADDYDGSGVLHGGTELVNINQVLSKYDYSELESIKDQIPEGREIWIGLARAVLKKCGCGDSMYRPNLIVLMKEGKDYKLSYVSPFLDFGIEILKWWEDQGFCNGKNLIIPNGISTWTIEKDTDKHLVDYMAFTFSRRDATVDLVYVKGLLNALLFDPLHPKLLNKEQAGFTKNTNVDCALRISQKYCKLYTEENKINEEFAEPKKEEQN